VPAGVSLASIAARAGVPLSTLEELNPQYLSSRTPPLGPDEPARLWAVYVPPGQGSRIAHDVGRRPPGSERQATVRARVGDTVSSIAHRLRSSEAEVREHNHLEPNERLQPGSVLLVPPSAELAQAGQLPPREDTESVVVVPPLRFQYEGRERVFYRALPGDDVDTVARAFQVSPQDLVLWNSLDRRAKLQSEMVLQVFVPKGARLDGVRFARERNTGKRLEVGSRAFFAHFEAEQGRQRLQILARAGDTLQSIGKRYGLSAGMMERINHFSRSARLDEGRPVVVYAKYGPHETEVLLSRAPDPLPPVDPPHPAALPSAPAR
jgi:membrane-bound lytic murein transglycosylase D